MYKIIETSGQDDWLNKRLQGIGASEAPIIMGVNYRKSLLQLWGEKIGLLEPDDLSNIEHLYWGSVLELPILRRFGESSGHLAMYSGELLRSSDHPWAQCTLDGWVLSGDERYPLEIKNSNAFMASEWESGPPPIYWLQVQHQLLVTGQKNGYIAALLGGNRLIWDEVQRDDIAINALIAKGSEFWRCVVECIQPDVTEHDGSALYRLHPDDNDEVVTLPSLFVGLSNELDSLKSSRKAISDEISLIENKIKAAIGDASYGVLPDGSGYSWKAQTRKAHTVKESTSRVLRRTKGK